MSFRCGFIFIYFYPPYSIKILLLPRLLPYCKAVFELSVRFYFYLFLPSIFHQNFAIATLIAMRVL
nr:MAG TPA: hypothetical protein [Caudoviricetes sp.]